MKFTKFFILLWQSMWCSEVLYCVGVFSANLLVLYFDFYVCEEYVSLKKEFRNFLRLSDNFY